MAYKKIDKICLYCTKLYKGTKLSKYCGYICAKKAREKKKELKCLECNKSFIVQDYSPAKFCSWKCKIKNQSFKIIKLNCKNCNKEFSKKEHKIGNNNFCSHKCSIDYNKGENHYEWKPLKHLTHRKSAFKKWGKIIKERDKYQCQLCPENRKELLEAHHIKTKELYPELEFNIDNGITLCLKCHALQHLDNPKALRLIEYKIKKYYNA